MEAKLIPILVNELSNTIDLDQTLTKAEALFRRFQRTVEAIDRKSSFPAPSTVRQRRQPSIGGQPTNPNSRATPALLKPATEASGATSGSDAVAATPAEGPSSPKPDDDPAGKNKGKGRQSPSAQGTQQEVEPMKTISPELRGLLSREVSKLDKKEVKKHGGGLG